MVAVAASSTCDDLDNLSTTYKKISKLQEKIELMINDRIANKQARKQLQKELEMVKNSYSREMTKALRPIMMLCRPIDTWFGERLVNLP
jgi:CRISPR/Cas system-associated endonuclease Cas3-HD